MSFEVHCPTCQKAYTADAKLVGKRIRCRQCAQVFLVESPDGASSSSTLGREGSRAGRGVATARVAASVNRPLVERTTLRATVPNPVGSGPAEAQVFPARALLEGWIPLVLCVISVGWIVAEVFSDNHSGAGWTPIVRLLGFAAAYFMLAVPLTFVATKKTLKRIGRGMPPSLGYRVIATFIFPATLAYVFSTFGGLIGFVLGSLIGLAVAAVVLWLLLRLEPQETANAFAVVGGTYFGASAAGAAMLVLLGILINQSLAGPKSTTQLHENPLGSQFAWTPPAAAPNVAVHNKASDNAPSPEAVPTGPTASQQPSSATQQQATPSTPAAPQPQITRADTSATGNVDIPKPASDDNDPDPEIRSGLFGNGAADLSDPFVKGVADAKLPWVRWVYRPSEQGIYEQSLTPLTPSVVVAFFRLPGIGGRTIESCRLMPTYRGLGALPLGDEGTDATATAGRYAITDDGATLLKITNANAAKVEVLPFRGPGGSVPLEVPADFAKSSDSLPATPELLGALPGRRFMVRWTGGDQSQLQVYEFQSSGGKLQTTVRLGQSDWPNVFGVSNDGNLFAIAEREAEQNYIVVRNLTGAAFPPMLFDLSDGQDKARWDCTGIAFSPGGSKIAALLEHGTEGKVRAWQVVGEHEFSGGNCKVPSGDEMLGQLKGRAFDWLTEGKWLVHGRTVLDATTGGLFGTLTDQVVTSQQMADDHTAYLSYLGADGHPHVAVVKFKPAALNAPQSKPAHN